MAQRGQHHNELLPSVSKIERLVHILDDVDLPDLMKHLIAAAGIADAMDMPCWVIRNGTKLLTTTQGPETNDGQRLGARYLIYVRPSRQRLVSTNKMLTKLREL
jgi:hypothetical protein